MNLPFIVLRNSDSDHLPAPAWAKSWSPVTRRELHNVVGYERLHLPLAEGHRTGALGSREYAGSCIAVEFLKDPPVDQLERVWNPMPSES